jgi:hypothetical protein
MKTELQFLLSGWIWVYAWCVLNGEISYTEELQLSLIYIVLFILISINSREMIRQLIINQNLKIIFNYEQLIYLKMNIILKGINWLKKLIQIINIKNIINIEVAEIKKKKISYINNKKKINNIRKIYYLFFILLSKII